MLESNQFNINCRDPLGRSALMIAIDNENLEMVEILVDHCDNTYDALLHAISEEFVEAVEVLLDCENLEPDQYTYQVGASRNTKTNSEFKARKISLLISNIDRY